MPSTRGFVPRSSRTQRVSKSPRRFVCTRKFPLSSCLMPVTVVRLSSLVGKASAWALNFSMSPIPVSPIVPG